MNKQQEAYREKAEAQLREWKADIEKLMARADQAKAEGKIEFYKRAETFNAKYEAARKRSEDLKGEADERWAEFKTLVDVALAELREALNNGMSKS